MELLNAAGMISVIPGDFGFVVYALAGEHSFAENIVGDIIVWDMGTTAWCIIT